MTTYLNNIRNSYGNAFEVIVANANSETVLNSNQTLPKSSLIIAAEYNKLTYEDTGNNSLLITDSYGNPVRLTYQIETGNGFNIDNDSLQLHIDNKTIIEQNGNLSATLSQVIDNDTLILDNNGNVKLNQNALNHSSSNRYGTFIVDGKTIKANNGTISIDTDQLDYATNIVFGIAKGDNYTVNSNRGIFSVNIDNLDKASNITYGIAKVDNTTIISNNGTISVNNEALSQIKTDDGKGLIKHDSSFNSSNSVLSVNENNIPIASQNQKGYVKIDQNTLYIDSNGKLNLKEQVGSGEIQDFNDELTEIENRISELVSSSQSGIYNFGTEPEIKHVSCNETTTTVLAKPGFLEEPINMEIQHVYVSLNIITNCQFNISIDYINNEVPCLELDNVNFNDEFSIHGEEALRYVWPSTGMREKQVILLFNSKNFYSSTAPKTKTTKIHIKVAAHENYMENKEILYSVIRYNSNYDKDELDNLDEDMSSLLEYNDEYFINEGESYVDLVYNDGETEEIISQYNILNNIIKFSDVNKVRNENGYTFILHGKYYNKYDSSKDGSFDKVLDRSNFSNSSIYNYSVFNFAYPIEYYTLYYPIKFETKQNDRFIVRKPVDILDNPKDIELYKYHTTYIGLEYYNNNEDNFIYENNEFSSYMRGVILGFDIRNESQNNVIEPNENSLSTNELKYSYNGNDIMGLEFVENIENPLTNISYTMLKMNSELPAHINNVNLFLLPEDLLSDYNEFYHNNNEDKVSYLLENSQLMNINPHCIEFRMNPEFWVKTYDNTNSYLSNENENIVIYNSDHLIKISYCTNIYYNIDKTTYSIINNDNYDLSYCMIPSYISYIVNDRQEKYILNTEDYKGVIKNSKTIEIPYHINEDEYSISISYNMSYFGKLYFEDPQINSTVLLRSNPIISPSNISVLENIIQYTNNSIHVSSLRNEEFELLNTRNIDNSSIDSISFSYSIVCDNIENGTNITSYLNWDGEQWYEDSSIDEFCYCYLQISYMEWNMFKSDPQIEFNYIEQQEQPLALFGGSNSEPLSEVEKILAINTIKDTNDDTDLALVQLYEEIEEINKNIENEEEKIKLDNIKLTSEEIEGEEKDINLINKNYGKVEADLEDKDKMSNDIDSYDYKIDDEIVGNKIPNLSDIYDWTYIEYEYGGIKIKYSKENQDNHVNVEAKYILDIFDILKEIDNHIELNTFIDIYSINNDISIQYLLDGTKIYEKIISKDEIINSYNEYLKKMHENPITISYNGLVDIITYEFIDENLHINMIYNDPDSEVIIHNERIIEEYGLQPIKEYEGTLIKKVQYDSSYDDEEIDNLDSSSYGEEEHYNIYLTDSGSYDIEDLFLDEEENSIDIKTTPVKIYNSDNEDTFEYKNGKFKAIENSNITASPECYWK